MNESTGAERAVLLMALGGPSSVAEVEPYLRDLRGGRPTPSELVQEFEERYRRIGGRTPLVEITQRQAQALAAHLAESGDSTRCEVGMRHWHPRISETVARLLDEGVREITGICMTPYYSPWSVGGYLAALREAVASDGRPVDLRTIESWHAEPSLAAAFAGKISARISSRMSEGVTDPLVLFTAHSLPGAMDPGTRPYVTQLGETRRAIERLLPPMHARLAYQSVGRREGSWLGPSAAQEIQNAARAGEKAVLVVPFGFVSDNLEILYDVDLEMRAQADRLGLGFDRTESLNSDPLLIEALARAVRSARSSPEVARGSLG